MNGIAKQAEIEVSSIDAGKDGSKPHYDLVRPGGPIEIMFALWSQLQIFSNINISATYTPRSRSPTPLLTPSLLYPALRSLIHRHPALAVVPVVRPSDKNPKEHITWEARLHSVDVSECVEWRDEFVYDEERGLERVIEELHNKHWWSVDDTERPHWRLVVLGGRHAVFCADHFIADGLSGFAFHRSLLRALNSPGDGAAGQGEGEGGWRVEVPKVEPLPFWHTQFSVKFSLLAVIWAFVSIHFLRWWYPPKEWLFADSEVDKLCTEIAPMGPGKRPTTRVASFGISAKQQDALLKECRARGASLTSLVYSAMLVTLAADTYPEAKIGVTGCPFTLRPFTVPKRSADEIYNSVGSFMPVERLEAWRAAGQGDDTEDKQAVGLNKEKLWALAADYKRRLTRDLTQSRKAFQGSLGMSMMGSTNEAFFKNGMSQLWLFQKGGFKISNIGVFNPKSDGEKEVEEGEWKIDNVEFSQSAEKSSYGSAGITMNMAGTKEGGSWLHFTYEEAAVKKEVVKRTVDGVKARLKLLAE